MLKYLWPLVTLTALALFVNWQGHFPYSSTTDQLADSRRYLAMAAQPFGSPNPLAHQAPYLWRPLTPLLVWLLPLPLFDGFWLLTLIGLAGATFALMWFLQGLGLPRGAIIAGALAFIFLMPATGWTLYDDTLVDPLAFALLTLSLAACVHRRGWLLLLALCCCALDKEIAIFGAIFALAWSWQKQDRLLLRWALVSAVSVLAILGLLRLFMPSEWSLSTMFVSLNRLYLAEGIEPGRLLLAMVGAWGVLLPLALASRTFWRTPAYWLLWLAATAQVLVSADIERVVVYAFPVMIAASGETIENLAKRWRLSRWWLWTPVFALELSWIYTAGPIYFFTLASLHLPLMGLCLIAALSLISIRIRQKLSPPV